MKYYKLNIFKRIFGINSDKAKDFSEKKEVMINISSTTNDRISSNASIMYESKIPEYCSIGNLIFEKKFYEAIELGKKLLNETPYLVGVHVNLMDAYFKLRNENPSFLEKSTEHAKLAMLYGHNTGYVQERLVINLEKLGKINQAIQVCNIVLMPQFHFSSHGCGNIDNFIQRKEKLINKLSKSNDNTDNELFTNAEITFLIEQICLEDERIEKERIEYEKRRKKFERDFNI